MSAAAGLVLGASVTVTAADRIAYPAARRAADVDTYHGVKVERLTALWNFERYGVPVKEGGRYFFTRNDGLQNQATT